MKIKQVAKTNYNWMEKKKNDERRSHGMRICGMIHHEHPGGVYRRPRGLQEGPVLIKLRRGGVRLGVGRVAKSESENGK